MPSTDDDALQAALAQFNSGIELERSEERARRALDKADKAKQQAAAELKKLQNNPNASAEDKAAADAAYREAVDTWNRRRAGEDDPPKAPADAAPEPEAAEPADAAPEPEAAEPADDAPEPEAAEPADASDAASSDAGADPEPVNTEAS